MEITRTFDLLDHYQEKYSSKNDVLAGKKENQWVHYTAQQYKEKAELLSYALMEKGYKRGDKIVTVITNRPEWNFIDMALSMSGIVHVPVYPTISLDDYTHILKHSDANCIIFTDKLLYRKIKPAIEKTPEIREILSVMEVEGLTNFDELYALGARVKNKYQKQLEQTKKEITEEDLLTIIYTSGTTGTPKGVMLTHKNLVSNFISTSKVQPLNHKHRILSFLPLCHVYERMMNLHFQYLGVSIYYAESLGTITTDIKELKVDGFNTVPRLLEKIYDKLVASGKDLTGIKKKIYFRAIDIALKFELNKANGPWYELRRKMYDKLVYSKWREALGGNVKIIVSGGSALQPRLARLFWCAGMKVMEGYGLTETSPVIAVSHAEYPNLKFGTVGPVLEHVEVKIAEDGEILTKGPNLMKGYYKDPEYTATVIDDNGYFHTGDVGYLDEGKFLKITDRKKEIFKLSAGKYIAPQIIENKFRESIFIEQVMVVGENEKFASALISPNFNHLHFWASKHKVHYRDNEELITMPTVVKRFQKEVAQVNKKLAQHEQIKRFRLVSEEWGPQTGELSPTLKLKRNFIYRKYEDMLYDIYKNSDKLLLKD